MKEKAWQKFTLILIRGADRPVRRTRISRRTLGWLTFLTGLVLTTAIGAAWLFQHHAADTIRMLSVELARSDTKYDTMQAEKQREIENLKAEIVDMTRHTQNMQSQLQQLTALEQEIKQLLRAVDSYDPKQTRGYELSVLSAETAQPGTDGSRADAVGGEQHAVSPDQWATFVSAARRSNQQLTANIEHADERLQHAKDHLQDLIRLLDSIPDFWPTHSTLVTSGFGVRADPFTGRTAFHYGLDIAGETGDAVYAAADGIIVAAGMDRSRGRYLIIEHERSVRTVYMHLQRLLVQEGDEVIKGEEIARLGSTGRSTGPHLHFEVIEHGRHVNPLLYLQRKTEP